MAKLCVECSQFLGDSNLFEQALNVHASCWKRKDKSESLLSPGLTKGKELVLHELLKFRQRIDNLISTQITSELIVARKSSPFLHYELMNNTLMFFDIPLEVLDKTNGGYDLTLNKIKKHLKASRVIDRHFYAEIMTNPPSLNKLINLLYII